MTPKKQKAAQPSADSPQPSQAQELLAQFGLTPEVLQSMMAPIIKQTMVDILKGSALEKTAIEFQEMKAALGPILDQIKAASQDRAGVPAADPGAAAQATNPLGDVVMQFLMNQMAPKTGASNPLDTLAATLEAVRKVADLANAPYSQGRRDALSETNDMLRLLAGAGAPPEKRTQVLAKTLAKELGGNGTGE